MSHPYALSLADADLRITERDEEIAELKAHVELLIGACNDCLHRNAAIVRDGDRSFVAAVDVAKGEITIDGKIDGPEAWVHTSPPTAFIHPPIEHQGKTALADVPEPASKLRIYCEGDW